ncbi:hypothetical protein LXL04_039536 [Taraxacum kok-saghyz]
MSGKGAKGLIMGKSSSSVNGSSSKDKDKKKSVTRSSRADSYTFISATESAKFPVGRVHRLLKMRAMSNGRVGATAAVYTAAMMNIQNIMEISLQLTFTSAGRRRNDAGGLNSGVNDAEKKKERLEESTQGSNVEEEGTGRREERGKRETGRNKERAY